MHQPAHAVQTGGFGDPSGIGGHGDPRRNTVTVAGEWLANTTMVKPLVAKEADKESAS